LEHIKKLDRNIAELDRKVNVQDGVIARLEEDNATLKDDNAALKVRVGILEDDNQVLREAIDGVSTFAWLGRDVTHNQSTANGSSSQTSTSYPARSSSQEDPEPMGTSQS
jgi:peptidoglycan hydrolase CwlO-like protein